MITAKQSRPCAEHGVGTLYLFYTTGRELYSAGRLRLLRLGGFLHIHCERKKVDRMQQGP